MVGPIIFTFRPPEESASHHYIKGPKTVSVFGPQKWDPFFAPSFDTAPSGKVLPRALGASPASAAKRRTSVAEKPAAHCLRTPSCRRSRKRRTMDLPATATAVTAGAPNGCGARQRPANWRPMATLTDDARPPTAQLERLLWGATGPRKEPTPGQTCVQILWKITIHETAGQRLWRYSHCLCDATSTTL